METWEIINSFHSVFGAYYVPGAALYLKQSGQNSGRFLLSWRLHSNRERQGVKRKQMTHVVIHIVLLLCRCILGDGTESWGAG